MTSIIQLLKQMIEQGASDLFCRAGGLPRSRVDGKLVILDNNALSIEDVLGAMEELGTLKQREIFKNNLDVDFSVYIKELDTRFRVCIFMQRNWPSIAIRKISGFTQTFEELNLPADILNRLCMERSGLVLLTGSMGSGKSTTIASMIEYINKNSNKHILTIEEPVEFIFKDKESLINQRENGIQAAMDGVTTLEEIMRVTVGDQDMDAV